MPTEYKIRCHDQHPESLNDRTWDWISDDAHPSVRKYWSNRADAERHANTSNRIRPDRFTHLYVVAVTR